MKIHCPVCNGTKNVYDSRYGSITCLNCDGTGIVENTFQQQEIKNRIEKQKRAEEFERAKELRTNTNLSSSTYTPSETK